MASPRAWAGFEVVVPPMIDADSPRVLPTVIVFLAVFNGVAWLPEQLLSIRRQIGVRVKLVVSVDSSADGSEAWIDAYAAEHNDVKVLAHGRVFGGAAPNFFRLLSDTEISDTDYVAFADQDDVWADDKLQRAVAEMRQRGVQGYSSDIVAFWPDGREKLLKKSQPQRRWDFLFESAGPGCTYVLDRDLGKGIQRLLRDRWEACHAIEFHDWLCYAYARANRHGWFIDSYAGLRYRQHGGNQIGANSGLLAYRRRLSRVLSGWGLDQSLRIASLVGWGEHPFVKKWCARHARQYLWLALHANQSRRRWSHRLVFAVLCVVLAVVGKRPAATGQRCS